MNRIIAVVVVVASLSLGCGGETKETLPNADTYFDKTKQKDPLGGGKGGGLLGTKDPTGDKKQPASKFD